MKVISVNVGLPKTYVWNDRTYSSGILKTPVSGSLDITAEGCAGDEQADRKHHGGPDMKVYAFPVEHYSAWEAFLGRSLDWGSLGENLSVEGLSESSVRIGDRYQVGTALLEVSQPRTPCFKLNGLYQRPDVMEHFLNMKCSGYYFRVLEPGRVEAGAGLVLIDRSESSVSIPEAWDCYYGLTDDRALYRKAAESRGLSGGWRRRFLERV
jgi:MOSC domain-containing protein YiiM